MPPTLANGKICYLEIPSVDIARSADFYKRVFGWNIRQRGDGHTAFDDTTGEVSGSWVLGRPPATKPGLLFYVMVHDVTAILDIIIASGGKIVQPIGADAPEITARFTDPAGNVIGLYQHRPGAG
jgi:predicted enzyme related to lactoylglutathione lyase